MVGTIPHTSYLVENHADGRFPGHRRVEIGHLLRALPGGHIVPVVLLHPDALDPEVEIATPLPQVHVYILINNTSRAPP